MRKSNRLLGVEVRHLAALQAVAASGSFARAARELGYTQSAVSLQVAALERAAGMRLLERPTGRRPVVPTAAGERVLRHARRLVAQLEAAEADLEALAAGTAGTLRVGTFQSISVRVLPAVVSDFLAARPDVEIGVSELGYDDELLALLERGRLDLSFTAYPAEGPFEQVELLRDPHLLIVPEGSPLAALRTAPTLREVGRLPLIGYGRSTYGIEGLLRARGIEPDIVFRTDESRALQRMVGAGIGHALVPSLSIEDVIPGAVLLDASRRVPPRRLGLAWHRDVTRSEVAQVFVALVVARCEGVQRELDARIARLAERPAAADDG